MFSKNCVLNILSILSVSIIPQSMALAGDQQIEAIVSHPYDLIEIKWDYFNSGFKDYDRWNWDGDEKSEFQLSVQLWKDYGVKEKYLGTLKESREVQVAPHTKRGKNSIISRIWITKSQLNAFLNERDYYPEKSEQTFILKVRLQENDVWGSTQVAEGKTGTIVYSMEQDSRGSQEASLSEISIYELLEGHGLTTQENLLANVSVQRVSERRAIPKMIHAYRDEKQRLKQRIADISNSMKATPTPKRGLNVGSAFYQPVSEKKQSLRKQKAKIEKRYEYLKKELLYLTKRRKKLGL